MPVKIEKALHPSEQDLIDLEKIYLDYPTTFRFPDLQSLLASQSTTSLYVGRFNNRLVGALSITVDHQSAHLNHLCTRKITRQRNVAKDMLRQLLAQIPYKTFTFNSCIEDNNLDLLLIPAGFQKTDNNYQFFRE